MGFHSFSLDPRTVLGVGPNASLEEIHEGYRAKSRKHHPDMGGDEWAFRMVARAYEVLKTTAAEAAARPWDRRRADVGGSGRSDEWAWTPSAPFGASGGTTPRRMTRARRATVRKPTRSGTRPSRRSRRPLEQRGPPWIPTRSGSFTSN